MRSEPDSMRRGPSRPAAPPQGDDDEETLPASPMTMQDGIKALQRAFAEAQTPPRWPMYVRQAKAFLRAAIEGFDERKYGFASVVDLLRAAGKEGVLRVDRDRQGAIRIFAGANLMGRPAAMPMPVDEGATDADIDAVAAPVYEPPIAAEAVADPPIVDAVTIEAPPDVDIVAVDPTKKGGRKRKTVAARAAKSPSGTGKTPKPRARKSARSKSEAADRS